MTGYAIKIPGEPIPKARPRVYQGHGITPKRTLDAEKRVRAAFQTRYPDSTPNDGPVEISAVFYMSKRGRPDLDNLLKLVMDALNGLAYQDDAQVIRFHATKIMPDQRVRGYRPGTMRNRRAGDQLTHHNEPYVTHTLVSINPI
jgi:Holliday junction resolvase RusA-like endonuclease